MRYKHEFYWVVEHCKDTGLYVGHVPGFSGAHSQGRTLDELNKNLQEVIAMLLEDGIPELETEFIGTQIAVSEKVKVPVLNRRK